MSGKLRMWNTTAMEHIWEKANVKNTYFTNKSLYNSKTHKVLRQKMLTRTYK